MNMSTRPTVAKPPSILKHPKYSSTVNEESSPTTNTPKKREGIQLALRSCTQRRASRKKVASVSSNKPASTTPQKRENLQVAIVSSAKKRQRDIERRQSLDCMSMEVERHQKNVSKKEKITFVDQAEVSDTRSQNNDDALTLDMLLTIVAGREENRSRAALGIWDAANFDTRK